MLLLLLLLLFVINSFPEIFSPYFKVAPTLPIGRVPILSPMIYVCVDKDLAFSVVNYSFWSHLLSFLTDCSIFIILNFIYFLLLSYFSLLLFLFYYRKCLQRSVCRIILLYGLCFVKKCKILKVSSSFL